MRYSTETYGHVLFKFQVVVNIAVGWQQDGTSVISLEALMLLGEESSRHCGPP